MSTTDSNIIPLAEPPPEKRPQGATKALPQAKVKRVKPKLAIVPMWPAPEEPQGRAWLVVMVFVGIIGIYGWMLSAFYAGAHGGVDQAGYLMTARLIAGDKTVNAPPAPAPPAPFNWPRIFPTKPELDSTAHPMPAAIQTNSRFDWIRNRLSFVPDTPYEFASRMCIMTEPFGPASATQPAQFRYYAKYPFGFPLMAALGRWLWGFDGMYYINPICTVLACYFAYFLFRQAISPFMSLIGVIWLATNPVVLNYANDANSHASTLFCVTAGFWGLLSWLRTGQVWRGCVGGFALGYACTIRYSEFLLVLPVACAALLHFRFTWRRSLEAIGVVLAWSIPVAALAAVCWVCFGAPWKTGYTYCNESTGFAWKYLTGDSGDGGLRQGNWETFVTQLNHIGLFMLWPLAITGIFALLGSAWRLGLIISLWVLPSAILYMLYYWAPGGDNNFGYLRFFMSIVPGMIFAALWILQKALSAIQGERRASLIAITIFGLFFYLCAALYFENEPLSFTSRFIMSTGSAIRDFSFESGVGMGMTAFIFLTLVGIWVWDRHAAAARTGMALAAGVLTALGCGFNLYTTMPDIEAAQVRLLGFRSMVDNLRQTLPKGSVILGPNSFMDDQVLNQLDCVGNWKLINTSLFNNAAFNISRTRLERFDKEPDDNDPNPIQNNRLRFYVELLGRTNAIGTILPPRPDDLVIARNALIDDNLLHGRRVAFIVSGRAKTDTALHQDWVDLLGVAQSMYGSSRYQIKPIRTWEFLTSDGNPVRQPRMAGNNTRANTPPAPAPEIFGLYEITLKTEPKNL